MRTIEPSATIVWMAPFLDGSLRRRTPSPSVFAITAVCPPGKMTAPAGEAKRYEVTRLVETSAVRRRKPRRVSRSVTRTPPKQAARGKAPSHFSSGPQAARTDTQIVGSSALPSADEAPQDNETVTVRVAR